MTFVRRYLGFLLVLVALAGGGATYALTPAQQSVILGVKPVPASLFAGGALGVWYDPSDRSTLFQDSTCSTTPVTADGDPVGCIKDKGGNGYNWTQATAGARPLYKTSGGLSWLEFDGIDDGLANASLVLANDSIALYALSTGSPDFVTAWGDNTSNEFFGVAQNGNAGAPDSNAGTPEYRINNGAPIARSRDAYRDAVTLSTPLVVEVRHADIAGWTAFNFGNYVGFLYAGRLYQFIVAVDTKAAPVRPRLLTYIGGKAGVPL